MDSRQDSPGLALALKWKQVAGFQQLGVVSNMRSSSGFQQDRCIKNYKMVQGNVHSITILTVRVIDTIEGLIISLISEEHRKSPGGCWVSLSY